MLVGGIIVPLACVLAPSLRRSRLALFLPSAALMPLALIFAYLVMFERRIRDDPREE